MVAYLAPAPSDPRGAAVERTHPERNRASAASPVRHRPGAAPGRDQARASPGRQRARAVRDPPRRAAVPGHGPAPRALGHGLPSRDRAGRGGVPGGPGGVARRAPVPPRGVRGGHRGARRHGRPGAGGRQIRPGTGRLLRAHQSALPPVVQPAPARRPRSAHLDGAAVHVCTALPGPWAGRMDPAWRADGAGAADQVHHRLHRAWAFSSPCC